MKISGAELQSWMNEAWPDDNYYWNHDCFEDDPDPETSYAVADLGPLLWQGKREDPTRGEGISVATEIRKWRKIRGKKTIIVMIPTEQEKALREAVKSLGGTIL